MEKRLLIFKTVFISFLIVYMTPLIYDHLNLDPDKVYLSGKQLVHHPIFEFYAMVSFLAMVITGALTGRMRLKQKDNVRRLRKNELPTEH